MAKDSKYICLTVRRLYRILSHMSRAISVPMYHPLKGIAVNSMPPQSSSIMLTAGTAYHFNPSSSNHGNLFIMKHK